MTQRTRPTHDDRYDVVILGAGPAGLSAALMLGRARRSVLVIDSGQPRNAPAAHMHGFLTRDGTPPAHLLDTGRDEVTRYGGQIITGHAHSATTTPDGFTVALDTDRTAHARRLLVTTGVTDDLPDIPGLRPRWGRDVLHCPYCHGWEVRDQPIGVLATSPRSVHQALLFRQWTDHLTLLLHTNPHPTPQEARQLAARQITVVTGRVTGLATTDDQLSGVHLDTGETIPLRALAVAPRAIPRATVLTTLGLEPAPHPSGAHIATDPTGLTQIPGVWAAGNLTNPAATVLGSAASGATAAAAINADLVTEDTDRAVHAMDTPATTEADPLRQATGTR
ncbi:NAD(P)/FAD-dependent oxidoreductase [Nocardiopsis sp. FIRDI 009]|uniref:NAD(P)/FAD-dependent oxidoreductase n=1 Tax=Nocardiopsis sp. FIRDI 009 TaxID=714197 RepID=UPI000E243E68|nr:NAD(P)/FAD-dependent oxidoreductase [Nocardiopsis sp. FIRDI 009]